MAIVAAVIVGLVGLFAVAALAQDEPEEGWGPPWRHGPWHGQWGPEPEHVLERRGELAADLGEQLDRSPQEVEAAFRAVVEQRLGEAVADGRIDQAQADEALAAYDRGELGALFEAFHDRSDHAASAMMGS